MTVVEICNRALAVIGHDRTISNISGSSAEEILCNRFYAAARDNVLAACSWEFASAEQTVSISGTSTSWSIPASFVRMVSVMDGNGNSLKAVRSGNSYTIYKNGTETMTATVRYVSNAAPSGGTFEATMPHLVAEAVVYELASLLFGPMIGNVQDDKGAALFESYMKLAASKLEAAMSAERSERAFMSGNRTQNEQIKTNIANRALACLGLDITISDYQTDPSPVAARIRLLYPTARDFVLSAHDWSFAAKEDTVSVSGTTGSWNIPSGFVRMVSIRDDAGNAYHAERYLSSYTIHNPIGTYKNLKVKYVSNEVANNGIIEASMPPLFVDAVVYRLAALVSGDQKIPTKEGEQTVIPDFERMLQAAISADISEKSFMGGKRGTDAEIKTNLANRALACLGMENAILDFDADSSPVAARIRLLYPTARDFVLSAHEWEFASVDAQVTVSGTTSTWTIPAGFVKLVSVRDGNGNVFRTSRYGKTVTIYNTTGGSVTATVRYVSNAIQNFETSMPPLFAEAIVCRMAYQLAGERIQTEDGKTPRALPDFGTALSAAISAEISERNFLGGSRSASDEKKTEIANRAIAKLGGQDTVSDFTSDQTSLAARIRLLFPSALDHVIRIRDWDFAAVETTIVLSGADASGYCRVAIPEDCMRIVRVMDEGRHPLKTVRNRDFVMVEGEGEKATIRYVSSDIDLSKAPDDFLDLLSLDLANRLAPTVLGDAKATAVMQTQLRTQFGETDMKEANETAFGGDYRNPFVAARD